LENWHLIALTGPGEKTKVVKKSRMSKLGRRLFSDFGKVLVTSVSVRVLSWAHGSSSKAGG